jgi:hypothetical protein
MPQVQVSVSVNLGEPLHAVLAEVLPCLPHLFGLHRVVRRFADGVGDHQRGHHADVPTAVSIEVRDSLDAGLLSSEFVDQASPDRLTQDEVH